MVLFCALVQILLKPFQIEKQQIEIDKAQHLLLGVSVSKTTAIPNEVNQESPELKPLLLLVYSAKKLTCRGAKFLFPCASRDVQASSAPQRSPKRRGPT